MSAIASELIETVEAAKRLICAIANHPDRACATAALQEIGSDVMTQIEDLHNATRLDTAQTER